MAYIRLRSVFRLSTPRGSQSPREKSIGCTPRSYLSSRAAGGAAGEDAAAEEGALQRAVAVHAAAAEAGDLARREYVAEGGAVGLQHACRKVGLQAAQGLAREDPQAHGDQRPCGRI